MTVDGEFAGFAAYALEEDRLVLTHTKISSRFEGRGVGSHLARAALDDLRRRGLHVHAQCAFIAAYIARHPRYADLASE